MKLRKIQTDAQTETSSVFVRKMAELELSLCEISKAAEAISKKWYTLTPYEMQRAIAEMDNLRGEIDESLKDFKRTTERAKIMLW